MLTGFGTDVFSLMGELSDLRAGWGGDHVRDRAFPAPLVCKE